MPTPETDEKSEVQAEQAQSGMKDPQPPVKKAKKKPKRVKVPYYVGLFQKLINKVQIPKPRHTWATFERVAEMPFPPLRNPEAWITPLQMRKLFEVVIMEHDRRPHDVLRAGPIEIGEVPTYQRDKLRRIIDYIELNIEDSQRRAIYALQERIKEQGDLDSSETAVESIMKQVRNDTIVQHWKQTRAYSKLVEADAFLSASATRKTEENDIERILATVEAAERNESAGLCIILMAALVRRLPNVKIWPLVEKNSVTMDDVKVDWETVYDFKRKQDSHDCSTLREATARVNEDQKLLLPAIARFVAAWRHMVNFNRELGTGAFTQAVTLETELARFRAVLPLTKRPSEEQEHESKGNEEEQREQKSTSIGDAAWAPVRRVLYEAHRRGKLTTSHVNRAMWAATRYGDSDIEGWPTAEEILEVYACMRLNLVEAERAQHRATEGIEETPADGATAESSSSRSASTSLLPAFEGCSGLLPRHIVPSVPTYCGLIRGLAWHGDLHNALTVFRDLAMTESHVPFEAYNGLFQAFGQHGIAGQVGAPKDAAAAVQSEADDNTGGWTLETLQGLLEGFLSMSPPRSEDPQPDENDIRAKNKPLTKYRKKGVKDYVTLEESRAKRKEAKELEEIADAQGIFMPSIIEKWANLPIPRPLHPIQKARIASSILELEDRLVPSTPPTIRADGPSDELIYHLILALERCSSQNKAWILQQCNRIRNKYGPGNREGWDGWHLMPRFDAAVARLSPQQSATDRNWRK